MKRKIDVNAIVHVYNRGVEKRKIFMDEKDYIRFIHDLFEFNDEEPAFNVNYYFERRSVKAQYIEVGLPYIERGPRKFLVEILAFCLMPNHFHLMLKQIREGGVTEFMRKLGTGYTNYFNRKYERVGSLFQGKYKVAILNRESHFIHLPCYIHTNPIDLLPGKTKGKTSSKDAIGFLQNYRWSSFLDYIGKENFPSVTQREFLLEFFGGEKEYFQETKKWLAERERNVKILSSVLLD